MAVHRDQIFKGCTRPAMMAGVPFVPLICTCILFGLVAVWGGMLFGPFVALMSLMCALVCLLLMREVCKKDDQRFRQVMLWLELRLGDRNRGFWSAVSYSPTRFRRRA